MKPTGIIVSGETEEQALEEVVRRLGVDRDAIDYAVGEEEDSELLEGATPEIQVRAWIRPDYIADRAETVVSELLELMGIESSLSVSVEDWMVRVDIEAEDFASLLIGKDGQNLSAMQYLINRIVLPTSREAPMIIVDVEGYRRKQYGELEDLVERAVKRARETGNEIELDSMPASIRKYLHNYLRRHDDVKTFSRGDDPDRYLVIIAD